MSNEAKKPLTDAQLKAKALRRWENEGGAVAPGSQTAAVEIRQKLKKVRSKKLTPTQHAAIARRAVKMRQGN